MKPTALSGTQLPRQDEWRAALQSGRMAPLRRLMRELGPLPPDAMLGADPLVTVVVKYEETAAEQARIRQCQRNRGEPEIGGADQPAAGAHRTQMAALLAAGADPNTADARGLTALGEACGAGSASSVRLLLASGANPNGRPGAKAGVAPLMRAAQSGVSAVVRLLLNAGAGTEGQDVEGRTALHHAAKGLHRTMIALLYRAGADWSVRDSSNRTPYDLIATNDPQLAEWWRHRPGHDALTAAVPVPAVPPARTRKARL